MFPALLPINNIRAIELAVVGSPSAPSRWCGLMRLHPRRLRRKRLGLLAVDTALVGASSVFVSSVVVALPIVNVVRRALSTS